VGEPAEDPAPTGGRLDTGVPRSPLVVFPGLDRLAGPAADAILVTDVDRRVVVWNEAAAGLFGIACDEAIGRDIADLFESRSVGHGTSAVGPRLLTIAEGNWRGRLIERALIGSYAGTELLVETALSRLEDEEGVLVGVLSVKREVGQDKRYEQELAALASIATAAEVARSRKAIAEAVLDRLIRATGATMGLVASHEGDRLRLEATRGLPATMRDWIERLSHSGSPMAQSLRAPGSVAIGTVATLPMYDESRALLVESGFRALAGVGLHRNNEHVGLLILAFTTERPLGPSGSMLIQAAAHLQRALDNAQLVEELDTRAAAERRLVDQQLALQSLTALSESSDDFGVLAGRTVEQIGSVLGGAAGSYTLLDGDGAGIDWFDWNTPPAARDGLRTLSLDPATPLRRFSQGEGPFLESFAAGTVARPESLELATSLGWVGYAALPIIISSRLEGIILIYFDRALETLAIEPMMLEAIARTASISLGNFRLRERLVDSETRYRTLFESSPEPYLVESLGGRVVDANAAAAELFGGSRDELIGLPVDRLTVRDEPEIEVRRSRLLEHGHATFRGTGVRLDGTTFPEEAVMSIVELAGRQRALVLIRDLSDQERLQQELIQAQKMDTIGQLVSGVAHELNNPLAAILGFSQLIRRDERLPQEMRNDANLLVEEATRTRRIVQNLLDFARQRPPERYPTSIRTLIEAVLVLQSYSLGPGRIEVEVDVPVDLPPVELDRSQIQQVVVNLTQNAIHAIQASGDGGHLRISAWLGDDEPDARVWVSVTDDGAGVAPEHVDQVFVPFFTTKAPSDGTGLGLPVSLGIIDSHGGELRYAPGPGGRGASFTFDLPVLAANGKDPDRPGPPAPQADDAAGSESDGEARDEPGAGSSDGTPSRPGSRRVLVLDDERSIRLLLDKWLRTSGYEPVIAATGDEAVEHVRDGPFDAILCDHRMAGMNGTEVFEAVVAIRPELDRRFVFMSGDVLNPQLRHFVEERGVGLLAKPFDLDTVKRTLQAVLDATPPSID